MSSNKRRAKPEFITLPQSGSTEPYEVSDVKDYPPPEAGSFLLDCPSCKKGMLPVVDVLQLGFWDDHYRTYFACKACHVAVVFVYDLSSIEVTPPPRGRRIGGRRKAV